VPIKQLFVVTIEFAGAALFGGSAQPGRRLMARNIRLVESRTESSLEYTLHDGDAPEYILSVEETAQLDHLLRQIEVKAPWQASAGLDGTDYELTLQKAMSSLTFRWWVEVPAEWKGVGAVFDHVLAVADRCHARGS
jgi:hypothetical protein